MSDNAKQIEAEAIRRLRQYREAANLTQLELALISGVSQNMIAYIETGKRTPSLATIIRLCEGLNINPMLLFSDSEEDILKAKKEVISLIERYMK